MAANLNETDEVRPIKIAEIRQWIMESEELHAPTGIRHLFQTFSLTRPFFFFFFFHFVHFHCVLILYFLADDFFILRFLRACKFNTEKTKSKLWNYYKQRANLPEWYSNRDPSLPILQELFDLG